jgi:hypothetical protein
MAQNEATSSPVPTTTTTPETYHATASAARWVGPGHTEAPFIWLINHRTSGSSVPSLMSYDQAPIISMPTTSNFSYHRTKTAFKFKANCGAMSESEHGCSVLGAPTTVLVYFSCEKTSTSLLPPWKVTVVEDHGHSHLRQVPGGS